MGQIIKRGRPDRPRFYLRYHELDGTRRMVAAKGAATEKEAYKQLNAIERRIFEGNVGVPQPAEPDPEQERRRTITVKEIGDAFTTRYSDRKKKDVGAYRDSQEIVLRKRIYPKLGDRAASSVTKRDVDAFLQSLTDDTYAPSSVNNTLNTLSKLYGWALADGLIDCANPCKGVQRFENDDADGEEGGGAIEPDKYLSKEEAQNLMTHTERMAVVGVSSWDALMLHPMVATALYAGLRKGELFGLRWSHVDLQRCQLTVSRSYAGKTKSKRKRPIAISPRLATILRGWKEVCPKTDAGLVFPVLGNEGAMGESWHMLGLEDAMKASASHVPPKPWHGLRHSFAAHFVMAGGNIFTLKELLGHKKVETTADVYAHLSPDFMAAEVARLDFSRPLPPGVADIAEARRKKILERLERDPDALWAALERAEAR